MIFDTHAHYDDEQFDADRDKILASLPIEGIGTVVNVGASMQSSQMAMELAKKWNHVYAAVGVHPDHADQIDADAIEKLRSWSCEMKTVAIGEIGLDYYWDKCSHEVQKNAFCAQLKLAEEVDLPVIIHSREAAQDTFLIMKEYKGKRRGVIHCYSGSAEMAKEYVKLGYFLGVGGVVTFKNAKAIKEVVKTVGLANLVLETDCPYLAPVPYRGKRNSSLYLPQVVGEIAALLEVSEEEVIRVTEENANKLYGLGE